MDERWATIRVQGTVYEIVAQGSDIKASIQRILDHAYLNPNREYRITINPTNGFKSRINLGPSQTDKFMGEGIEPGMGHSSTNEFRRDRPENGGSAIRPLRSTAYMEGNGSRIEGSSRDRGDSGQEIDSGTQQSLISTDKEYTISDTGLRIGVENYFNQRRGTLWQTFDVSDEKRKKEAKEWLYETIREVLGEEGKDNV